MAAIARLRTPFTATTPYPRSAPLLSRRDAWPPTGGPPGSDLAFMRQQHLDALNVEFGLLQVQTADEPAKRCDALGDPGPVTADCRDPLARAFLEAAPAGGALPAVSNFRADPGRGVVGTVEGHQIAVGNRDLALERLALCILHRQRPL